MMNVCGYLVHTMPDLAETVITTIDATQRVKCMPTKTVASF